MTLELGLQKRTTCFSRTACVLSSKSACSNNSRRVAVSQGPGRRSAFPTKTMHPQTGNHSTPQSLDKSHRSGCPSSSSIQMAAGPRRRRPSVLGYWGILVYNDKGASGTYIANHSIHSIHFKGSGGLCQVPSLGPLAILFA